MAPLAIYALQTLAGFDPIDAREGYRDFYVWIKSSWLPMELGTIAAALLALVFFPFPFLTMIIAFCLWFMSMDLTPWLMGAEHFSWDQRATVSLWFGLAVIAVAWLVDMKKWRNGDFAFWLHLFGLMAFWGGLTAQHSGGELGKAFYCAINVGLVFLSIFLMRRVYAVFGAIGVTTYLGYLSSAVFQELDPLHLRSLGHRRAFDRLRPVLQQIRPGDRRGAGRASAGVAPGPAAGAYAGIPLICKALAPMNVYEAGAQFRCAPAAEGVYVPHSHHGRSSLMGSPR